MNFFKTSPSPILFCSTFNQKLYECSGKQLVETFTKFVPWGTIFISHEDDIRLPQQNIISYNLHTDKFLQSWLKNNSDIIPQKFGGEADITGEMFTQTKQHGFRRRASMWFRKIANLNQCLKYAIKNNYSYIVGLDCDVVFKKTLPLDLLINLIENNDLLGYYGPKRKSIDRGLECGLVMFNLKKKGREFLECIFELYQSGNFKNYLRWDDSYLFAKTIEQKGFRFKDLAVHPTDSRAMDYGPLVKYLIHNKGSHVKQYGLFK